MDDPNSTARAEAAAEIAGAALALARARDRLTSEQDGTTRNLIEYVHGWANRALVECIEPNPETEQERSH